MVGVLALCSVTTMAPRAAHASGFLIYDLSGEAIGRGSAVSAGVTEPAAVWFNPGGTGVHRGTKRERRRCVRDRPITIFASGRGT